MDDLIDAVVIGFIFALDGIKRFRYTILATFVALGILFWIWSIQHNAEQACRDKGGVPISDEYDVKCATGLIK